MNDVMLYDLGEGNKVKQEDKEKETRNRKRLNTMKPVGLRRYDEEGASPGRLTRHTHSPCSSAVVSIFFFRIRTSLLKINRCAVNKCHLHFFLLPKGSRCGRAKGRRIVKNAKNVTKVKTCTHAAPPLLWSFFIGQSVFFFYFY